jgi:hypothetical protein
MSNQLSQAQSRSSFIENIEIKENGLNNDC